MQTKICFNIIFILCTFSTVKAQPDYSLLNHVKTLDAKLYIDSADSHTFNQILSADFSVNFTNIPDKCLAKPNASYWIKMDLDSVDLSATDKWYISFNYYDKITLYFNNSGEIDSIQAGARNIQDYGVNDFTDFPFTKNELLNGHYLYAKIKTYRNTYFIESPLLTNDFYLSFFKRYLHLSYFKKQIPYFIFIGGITLILFYFIGIYFLYRDKQFLIYSLYLLSLLLYLGAKASLIQDFFRINTPFFIHYYNNVIQVIVNISYLIFSIVFLNAKKDFPILFKFIVGTIYLLTGVVLLQTIIYTFWTFSQIDEIILTAERYYMILFSVVAYVYILKTYTNKLYLFFVAGSFIFLTGAIFALAFRNIHLMMYGAAIEVFIFSLAMGYRIKQIENEKISIENEMTKVELTALRAQMNPHFIFNSLNSIRAYVISNEIKKASAYITKFSKLIRIMLHYSSKETISLQDEIKALQLYVQLEELRFRMSFGFELHLGDGVSSNSVQLPPLILQPYIENAILHGLAPKMGTKKLDIYVNIENDKMIFKIKDNGVGRKFSLNSANKSKDHVSVAMELTRKRIDLLGDSHSNKENIEIIDIEDGEKAVGTMIILQLPVRIIESSEKILNK